VKAQVTVFIIVGILLAIIIALVMSIRPDFGNMSDSDNTKAVKAYMEACLGNVVHEGIKYTALRAGYYNPAQGLESLWVVPYYVADNRTIVPPKEEFERQLSMYILDNIGSCMSGQGLFNATFLEKDNSAVVSLGKSMTVELYYPMEIKSGNSVARLSEFSYSEFYDYDRLKAILDTLSEVQMKSPNAVPLGAISVLSDVADFSYLLTYSGDDVLYSLIFQDIFTHNETLIFNYAADYDWPEQGNSLTVKPIPPLTANPGYEFHYRVESSIERARFSDFTELFDINPATGEISFMPEVSDAGVHNIIITAKDDKENEAQQVMRLEIVKDNMAPLMNRILDQNVSIGSVFRHNVIATDLDGKIVLYAVETSLKELKISPFTGEIEFSPTIADIGKHTVTVAAVDDKAAVGRRSFILVVNDET
jgi:hypothetical protein